MKKNELVRRVARDAGLSHADAEKAVGAFTDALCDIGRTEDSLTLKGVGTFKGAVRPERNGRNPATGAAIVVPSKKVLSFRMSPTLEL